jgi:hypothetical protein
MSLRAGCRRTAASSSNCLTCLIIPLVIRTIRLDSSGSIWIDDASNVSKPDWSGADQIDAEHHATDLAIVERQLVAVSVSVHQPSPDGTLAVWLDSAPDVGRHDEVGRPGRCQGAMGIDVRDEHTCNHAVGGQPAEQAECARGSATSPGQPSSHVASPAQPEEADHQIPQAGDHLGRARRRSDCGSGQDLSGTPGRSDTLSPTGSRHRRGLALRAFT